MLFVGTSIIHPSTEGVFLLCNILDLLIYSMYLFEDAAKQKRATLFEGCFQNSSRYSEICKEFDEHGIGIFNHDIVLAADPEDTAGPLAGTMPENE